MLQAFSKWENLSVVILSLVLRTSGFVCPVICNSFCKCFHLCFFKSKNEVFSSPHEERAD